MSARFTAARGWHTGCMRLWDVSKILHYNTKRKPADRKVSLRKEEQTVAGDWDGEVAPPRRSAYLVYFSCVTFLFFLAAVGIAYYVSVSGIDRTVSTSKINIVTQGPAVTDGGAVVPLVIRIANRNPIAIRDVSLTVTYPDGSYGKDGGTAHVSGGVFSWEVIDSGEVASARIAPILYGLSGERKNIRYELRYLADGSSQPTKINDSYGVLLRSSPLHVSTPRHTTPIAGKEFSFSVTVRSDTAETPPDAFLVLDYPSGFVPTGFSSRPADAGAARWRVPYLRSGEEFTLTVRGVIRGGERNEQAIIARVFAKPSGIASDSEVVVAREETVFSIGKSFLGVTLDLNGDGTDVVVSPGGEVEAEVTWENQDSDRLQNMILTATVSGSGLDESSIRPGSGGYFDEISRNIIWDQQQSDAFSSVAVGGSGSVSFDFRILPNRTEFDQAEKSVRVSVSAEARRAATGGTESIRDIAVADVSVRSVLQVVGNTVRKTASVPNSGPVPPRVGKTTSYALKYFIKNTGSTVSDVVLRIPLAREAVLTKETAGILGHEWVYDRESHAVTVTIPSLAPVGPRSRRLLEFQVLVTPLGRDVGRVLPLTKQSSYGAYDTYTREEISGSVPALTTRITAEPTDGPYAGVVVAGEGDGASGE